MLLHVQCIKYISLREIWNIVFLGNIHDNDDIWFGVPQRNIPQSHQRHGRFPEKCSLLEQFTINQHLIYSPEECSLGEQLTIYPHDVCSLWVIIAIFPSGTINCIHLIPKGDISKKLTGLFVFIINIEV